MNLTRQEASFKSEDSEYYHVMLDIADLIRNCTKVDDPQNHAARAIAFVLQHQDRELEEKLGRSLE